MPARQAPAERFLGVSPAFRAPCFCSDHMRFHASLPAADFDAVAGADRDIPRLRHQAQTIARDHEPPVDRLAMFAEAGGDVHRVAEMGELALGVAAFADDDRAGVDAGAEEGATPNARS